MTKVFCTQTKNKEQLAFYVSSQGETHYLFSQNYTNELNEFFKRGVDLNRAMDFTFSNRNKSISKVMQKLPSYIRYIEQEYDIAILQKTKKKSKYRRVA